MNRSNFLKLGALFVPAVAAPTVAYSFLGFARQRKVAMMRAYALRNGITPPDVLSDLEVRVGYIGTRVATDNGNLYHHFSGQFYEHWS